MAATDLRIPFSTLLKLFLAVLLFLAIGRLAPLLMLVFIASLIAVTLHPVVIWLQRALPRWLSLMIVAVLLIGGTLFTGVVLIPSIAEQMTLVFAKLPKLQSYAGAHIPAHGLLHDLGTKALNAPTTSDPSLWMSRLVTFGTLALGGLFQVGVLLIVSLYLLSDGPRAYAWLLAFFKDETRAKIVRTSTEMSQIIFAYVAGQIVTSVLVFIFVFSVLSFFDVPAALALAVVAAIFDILPIIGFFLSLFPAVALAFSVSPWTALVVGLLYLAYHLIESYFIVPKVYGNRLRLSDLTVILGLLAADLLAGIPGAIAVLPVLAAYPVIERIWLVDRLGRKVVEKHVEQAASPKEPAKIPQIGKQMGEALGSH